MAYVAMTRGRHNNEAFLYQKFSNEADHEHAKPMAAPAIHQLRRGNKHSAAYYFRQILGNDDRPRTMHAEAERAEQKQSAERQRVRVDDPCQIRRRHVQVSLNAG